MSGPSSFGGVGRNQRRSPWNRLEAPASLAGLGRATTRTDPLGDFRLRPFDLRLELVAYLHLVLHEFVEPVPDSLEILKRTVWPGPVRFL